MAVLLALDSYTIHSDLTKQGIDMPHIVVSDKVSSSSLPISVQLTITGNFEDLNWAFNKQHIITNALDQKLSISLIDQVSDASAIIGNYVCTTPQAITNYNTSNGDLFTFTANLLRNQMVHLGLIIHVTEHGTGLEKVLFCDPQIGNDPDDDE